MGAWSFCPAPCKLEAPEISGPEQLDSSCPAFLFSWDEL